MGFFLVHIFLYSDRIQENTNQKKLRIWTLFTQCQNQVDTEEQCVKSVISVILVALLLTLNRFHKCFSVSIVDFEQVGTECLFLCINCNVCCQKGSSVTRALILS